MQSESEDLLAYVMITALIPISPIRALNDNHFLCLQEKLLTREKEMLSNLSYDALTYEAFSLAFF